MAMSAFFFFEKNLAYSSQLVLRTVSDSFAPQQVISYDVPPQRVEIRLRVLLRLLYLLVIHELLDARRRSFLSLSLSE